MYAIKRERDGKILAVGNVWKKPEEHNLMVWYEKALAEHYMKHAVPNRIKTQVISI